MSRLPYANDLLYFMEIARCSNLSRASERLGVSQPSLSVAIRRLETTIGTNLLIRSQRGVVLTQAGKQLLANSYELMQLWEQIKSRSLSSQDQVQGSFIIGCHPSVAIYSLPPFLAETMQEFPNLEIRLNHDLSRKIVESVIAMKTDIGIVVNPVRHPDLVIKKLCTDQVTFWHGPGSREIQNWQSQRAIIICDPDLLQTQDLIRKAKKMGMAVDRLLPTSNLEVVRSLTASGAGIGILPSRVANSESTKLKQISQAPVFQDEICLVYRQELKSVQAIQTLIGRIQSAFKN